MPWEIEFAESASKALNRLGTNASQRVLNYLRERIANSGDPRAIGKPLRGPLGEFWRYRVGDIRVICVIEDSRLVVLVVRIGDRKDVYR